MINGLTFESVLDLILILVTRWWTMINDVERLSLNLLNSRIQLKVLGVKFSYN